MLDRLSFTSFFIHILAAYEMKFIVISIQDIMTYKTWVLPPLAVKWPLTQKIKLFPSESLSDTKHNTIVEVDRVSEVRQTWMQFQSTLYR